jgi:hypothetical protein
MNIDIALTGTHEVAFVARTKHACPIVVDPAAVSNLRVTFGMMKALMHQVPSVAARQIHMPEGHLG